MTVKIISELPLTKDMKKVFEEANASVASRGLIDQYLSGVLKEMKDQPRSQQDVVNADVLKDANLKGIRVKEVEEKQAEVKESLKKYGVQEKLNYYSDAKAMEADPNEAVARNLFMAGMGVALGVTSAVAGSAEAAVGTMGAAALYMVTKSTMRYLGQAETPDQAKKIDEYTDLKHAQFALKKLKKAVQAPAKAAEKAAYKKDVQKAMAIASQGMMARTGRF